MASLSRVTLLLKEIADFYRFFWGTPKAEKDIIFYAEHENYYPYFEGLIKELIGEHNRILCYVTSDPNDPVLQKSEPKIEAFYLDKLLPFFMAFVNCRILVMTMTDLNLFHIRRSVHPVHYVYVFHSPVSTHMIYRFGAFDFYDSILCVGPHQVAEICKHEELYGLKSKRLVEVGYYRLEKLYEAHKGYNKEDDKVTVLVAPTWGPSNLLQICGKELFEALLNEDYKIVLRLHPETVKKHQFSNALVKNGVTLETSVVSMDSLVRADILITDWSGIGLKYAFGTERPVIFIDTPPKVNNPEYQELEIEPIESHLRDKIGVVVSLNNIETIPDIILEMMNNRDAWKSKLFKLRSEYVFNFGKSSEVGVNYINEVLQNHVK